MKGQAFNEILAAGTELQARFPELELVAVGDTVAAVHCRHRMSFDVDCVTPHLSRLFDQTADALQSWEGWKTNRQQKPILILGERHDVELGIRQLRRSVPLQVTRVRGLCVPTAREILRIKAFLCVERRAARDFIDVAALAHRLGEESALRGLKYLNLVYPSPTSQSRVTQFAEACEMGPLDLSVIPLPEYKGLQAPWNDWPLVQSVCQGFARKLLKMELNGQLPSSLDEGFAETTPFQ